MQKFHLTFEELQEAVACYLEVYHDVKCNGKELKFDYEFKFTGHVIEEPGCKIDCNKVSCDVEVFEC
jgi:hypothetical protein